MRHIFLFFCFLLGTLFADEPHHIVEIEGKILSIQKYQLINEPAPLIQVILRSRSEDYVVELGPVWFFKLQGFYFNPSSRLTVRGQLVEKDGRKTLIADEVKKGNISLKVRNEKGEPLWLSWRNES